MKDEEKLEDLKQFIAATVSQTEERLSNRIENVEIKLEKKIEVLRQQMHGGFSGVGEAIEEIHVQMEKRDKEVDKRLVKIGQQAT